MEDIKKVLIWPKWLRISHWLLASGISFELISAWLIQNAHVDINFWSDWHVMIGQVLSLVILVRLFYLIKPGAGYWRQLIPNHSQLNIIKQTLLFYASLGRLQLPDWHLHNPLWQPLYLLVLLLILLITISGLLFGNPTRLLWYSVSGWHGFLAQSLAYFILAHIAAVLIHDWNSESGHISAMLSGFKYFQIKPLQKFEQETKQQAEQSVSLDKLLKK